MNLASFLNMQLQIFLCRLTPHTIHRKFWLEFAWNQEMLINGLWDVYAAFLLAAGMREES